MEDTENVMVRLWSLYVKPYFWLAGDKILEDETISS
jgi:hypothetical protein